jgi:uncharacterized protein YjiS (DUF1127 family)
MSATIPLPRPAALRPHDLFARAGSAQSDTATPAARRAAAPPTPVWRVLLRDVLEAWRQHRAQQATRRALLQLDVRTLRDIGFVAAEIDSVAAEVHGGVAATRARMLAHAGPIAN